MGHQKWSRRSRSRLILLVLPSVLGLLSCGGEGSDASEAAGIPTLATTQDLRIDGYEEDLVPIQWLGVTSTGRIALLQWQDHNVRFYDPSGRLLATVGREGEGPGEFQRLVRAGWIGDTDTLWVSDTQLNRAVVISPDLETVRTVRNHELAQPSPADSGRFATYMQPSPYAMFGDGSSLVWAILALPGSGPELEGPPVLRLSPDGEIMNLVGVIGYVDRFVTVSGSARRAIPYVPGFTWTMGSHGTRMATLTTDMALPEPAFRVQVVDAAGEVVFDRSYPFEPEPIPSAVMDSAIATTVSTLEGAARAQMEAQLRAHAPELYPEAEQVVIGRDHRIWVGMRPRPQGRRWLALSPTGEPEAEVVLPSRVTVHTADREYLWCTEEDELGVESVVRYRMAAASPRGA